MVKPHILLLLFCFNFAFSQVVINEIDADNPGSDNKEFIELKSTVPSFSLNGFSLVFLMDKREQVVQVIWLLIWMDI